MLCVIILLCALSFGEQSFAAPAEKAGNQDKLSHELQTLLTKANDAGEFSGVVLAARDGKVTARAASGLADRSWNIPNDSKTIFPISSVTKQFTALLVMQLVEANKLSLDKTVADYLPDFRRDTGAKIKLRDLLHSASGLVSLPDEFYVNEDEKMTDPAFVVSKYLKTDLTFTPGSKFNYNNADFILLSAVLEKVTGQTYSQLLQQHILEPLGMKESGLLRNAEVLPRLARGYIWKDSRFQNEGFVQRQNFGAAGAMYSTADDLLRWDDALLNNKLLSAKTTAEMFTAEPSLGFVALGSWSYDLKLGQAKLHLVERQGHVNGACALNLLAPEEKLSVIFLSNVESETLFRTYAAQGLSYHVLELLLGE